jgi:hypothetical protein
MQTLLHAARPLVKKRSFASWWPLILVVLLRAGVVPGLAILPRLWAMAGRGIWKALLLQVV